MLPSGLRFTFLVLEVNFSIFFWGSDVVSFKLSTIRVLLLNLNDWPYVELNLEG